MANVVGRALHALTEVPGGAVVAALLQRHANDTHLAVGTASIAEVLETMGTDGRTLDAHVQDAVRIALAVPTSEAAQLRRALFSLAIARALSTRSHLGHQWDPVLLRDEMIGLVQTTTTVSDSLVELGAAAFELQRAGLIVTRKGKDPPPELPWDAIGPYHFFFCRTDVLFQHWDPEVDAREICKRARRSRVVDAAELGTNLGWGPRRLNSAVTFAQLRHWINVPYRRASGTQYVVAWAYLTEEGRRSAET